MALPKSRLVFKMTPGQNYAFWLDEYSDWKPLLGACKESRWWWWIFRIWANPSKIWRRRRRRRNGFFNFWKNLFFNEFFKHSKWSITNGKFIFWWQWCWWQEYVDDFIMATDLRCWRRFSLSVFFNLLNSSPTSQICHQKISFKTSVTNIIFFGRDQLLLDRFSNTDFHFRIKNLTNQTLIFSHVMMKYDRCSQDQEC